MNQSTRDPPTPTPRRTRSTGSAPAPPTAAAAASAAVHRRHSISAVPFSWEQRPGLPKQRTVAARAAPRILSIPSPPPFSPLPPPPPLHKKNSNTSVSGDPFTVALAECTKEPPTPPEIWGIRAAEAERTRRRLGLGVYGPCKSAWACSVVESSVYVPRNSVVQTTEYRFFSRRFN